MLNQDEEKLKYQLDFHYQSVKEAIEKFEEHYLRIILGLKQGKMKCNTKFERSHIIKVICGFGHGRVDPNKKGLKEAFLMYFTERNFNFGFLPQLGIFIIKAEY